jgi:hypothetical protein
MEVPGMRALTVVVVAAFALAVTNSVEGETYYQQAKRIVYATFPADTEAAALRVVGCETGYTYQPWSYNRSGASGLFQVLTGNAGRVLTYRWPNGRYERLTIRGWERVKKHGRVVGSVNRLLEPWYNAKVALFLSKGGHDFHEWSCQP